MHTVEEARVQRSDVIDAAIFAWVGLYVWINHWTGATPIFAPGFALLLPLPWLYSKRTAIPELRRVFQSLGMVLLCLATAPLLAELPVRDRALHHSLPVVFYYWAFYLALQFSSRSLGLSVLQASRDAGLRPFFVPLHITAICIAIVDVVLLEFSEGSAAMLLASAFWLFPFCLTWFCVRRVPLERASSYLEHPKSWARAFPGGSAILEAIALVSFFGFLLARWSGESWRTWAILSTILFLQAVVITEVKRWAIGAVARGAI